MPENSNSKSKTTISDIIEELETEISSEKCEN